MKTHCITIVPPSSGRVAIAATLLSAFFCVFFCIGCHRTPADASKDGKSPDARKMPGGEEVVFSSEGEVLSDGKAEIRYAGGKTVAVPKGFPSHMIYPGATVSMAASDNESQTVVLEIADTADKAKQFYENNLETNGWKRRKMAATVDLPEIVFVAERKSRIATIFLTPESTRTKIRIVVSEKL